MAPRATLLQHALLLLLLLPLPLHHGQDDAPLLLRQVAQVRHLRPGPGGRSRHPAGGGRDRRHTPNTTVNPSNQPAGSRMGPGARGPAAALGDPPSGPPPVYLLQHPPPRRHSPTHGRPPLLFTPSSWRLSAAAAAPVGCPPSRRWFSHPLRGSSVSRSASSCGSSAGPSR